MCRKIKPFFINFICCQSISSLQRGEWEHVKKVISDNHNKCKEVGSGIQFQFVNTLPMHWFTSKLFPLFSPITVSLKLDQSNDHIRMSEQRLSKQFKIFHHLALLVALVSCSSNFYHLALLALFVVLVLHQGDSADLNFVILYMIIG